MPNKFFQSDQAMLSRFLLALSGENALSGTDHG